MSPLASHRSPTDVHGLRACAFALLGLVRKQQGDVEAERAYLKWAQASVDHALDDAERPSSHLVSALTLLELAKMFDGREDGTLAGLAHRLSELTAGVDPGISYCAAVFYRQSLYARCGTIWPPTQPPIGASAHACVGGSFLASI